MRWIIIKITAAIKIGVHDISQVVILIDECSSRLSETSLLFSLLATMRGEAFRDFRTHTEGASVIQSRSYKRIESLCCRPDKERLNSIVYQSVPEVRQKILENATTLDDVFYELKQLGTDAEVK